MKKASITLITIATAVLFVACEVADDQQLDALYDAHDDATMEQLEGLIIISDGVDISANPEGGVSHEYTGSDDLFISQFIHCGGVGSATRCSKCMPDTTTCHMCCRHFFPDYLQDPTDYNACKQRECVLSGPINFTPAQSAK